MIADVTEARADELNRMIAARPKDSTGVCAAQPAADYFYDAGNLRTVKRLWSAGGTQPLSFTTTVRGGLDGLSDITTHVSDGKEATQPYEQKNYVYGPGGLIASEKRTLFANTNPRWQLFGGATGCGVNNPAASAEALNPNGYDLALNFGACPNRNVRSMTLEWHELNADGTPKDCTNQRTDATTNFNARYNCGLLHLNPATGTARLYKLKYASTSYDVKVTESVEMGLYGTKTFVVSRFTASLAKGQPATALAYADQTPAPPAPGGSLAAPGPGGREVNYYQKDHLGTIRVVSDENGTVLSTHDYEPFGLELPSQDFSFNTHRFTGHERDTETGLDYMKARYFGASMGRFGAVDSGIESNVNVTGSWNRYSFVANNPIIYLDGDGHLKLRVNEIFQAAGERAKYQYQPTFYSIWSDNKIFKKGVSKGLDVAQKEYPIIKGVRKAATAAEQFKNIVEGKQAIVDVSPLKDIKNFNQRKFENSVDKQFKEFVTLDNIEHENREKSGSYRGNEYDPTAQSPGEKDWYTSHGLEVLQKAVDSVVDKMVADGKIAAEEGKKIKDVYNVDRLKADAEKAASQLNVCNGQSSSGGSNCN